MGSTAWRPTSSPATYRRSPSSSSLAFDKRATLRSISAFAGAGAITSAGHSLPKTGEHPVPRGTNLTEVAPRGAFPTKGLVIAEGECTCTPEQKALSLTYDQLLADNAERLKEELANDAESCVDVFQ